MDDKKIPTRNIDANPQSKIEKWVAPKAKDSKEIEKHRKILFDLYQNLNDLEAVESMLSHTFTDFAARKTALNAIKKLRTEIAGTVNQAFLVLEDLAKKHIPKNMETLALSIEDFLLKHLDPASYKDMTRNIYISSHTEDSTEFSYYISLKTLVNIDGFAFDDFCIILTGIITREGFITYKLTALPDFKLPGDYDLGKEVGTSEEVQKRVKSLLNNNDILSELVKRPLKLESSRLKSMPVLGMKEGSRKIVNKIELKDDELLVILNPRPPEILGKSAQQVQAAVISYLKKIFKTSVVKAKYKPGKGDTLPVISFMLVSKSFGKDNKYTLNMHKLKNDLQHLLGLTDDEVDSIKESLRKHL
jgi:hypothetical protein